MPREPSPVRAAEGRVDASDGGVRELDLRRSSAARTRQSSQLLHVTHPSEVDAITATPTKAAPAASSSPSDGVTDSPGRTTPGQSAASLLSSQPPAASLRDVASASSTTTALRTALLVRQRSAGSTTESDGRPPHPSSAGRAPRHTSPLLPFAAAARASADERQRSRSASGSRTTPQSSTCEEAHDAPPASEVAGAASPNSPAAGRPPPSRPTSAQSRANTPMSRAERLHSASSALSRQSSQTGLRTALGRRSPSSHSMALSSEGSQVGSRPTSAGGGGTPLTGRAAALPEWEGANAHVSGVPPRNAEGREADVAAGSVVSHSTAARTQLRSPSATTSTTPAVFSAYVPGAAPGASMSTASISRDEGALTTSSIPFARSPHAAPALPQIEERLESAPVGQVAHMEVSYRRGGQRRRRRGSQAAAAGRSTASLSRDSIGLHSQGAPRTVRPPSAAADTPAGAAASESGSAFSGEQRHSSAVQPSSLVAAREEEITAITMHYSRTARARSRQSVLGLLPETDLLALQLRASQAGEQSGASRDANSRGGIPPVPRDIRRETLTSMAMSSTVGTPRARRESCVSGAPALGTNEQEDEVLEEAQVEVAAVNIPCRRGTHRTRRRTHAALQRASLPAHPPVDEADDNHSDNTHEEADDTTSLPPHPDDVELPAESSEVSSCAIPVTEVAAASIEAAECRGSRIPSLESTAAEPASSPTAPTTTTTDAADEHTCQAGVTTTAAEEARESNAHASCEHSVCVSERAHSCSSLMCSPTTPSAGDAHSRVSTPTALTAPTPAETEGTEHAAHARSDENLTVAPSHSPSEHAEEATLHSVHSVVLFNTTQSAASISADPHEDSFSAKNSESVEEKSVQTPSRQELERAEEPVMHSIQSVALSGDASSAHAVSTALHEDSNFAEDLQAAGGTSPRTPAQSASEHAEEATLHSVHSAVLFNTTQSAASISADPHEDSFSAKNSESVEEKSVQTASHPSSECAEEPALHSIHSVVLSYAAKSVATISADPHETERECSSSAAADADSRPCSRTLSTNEVNELAGPMALAGEGDQRRCADDTDATATDSAAGRSAEKEELSSAASSVRTSVESSTAAVVVPTPVQELSYSSLVGREDKHELLKAPSQVHGPPLSHCDRPIETARCHTTTAAVADATIAERGSATPVAVSSTPVRAHAKRAPEEDIAALGNSLVQDICDALLSVTEQDDCTVRAPAVKAPRGFIYSSDVIAIAPGAAELGLPACLDSAEPLPLPPPPPPLVEEDEELHSHVAAAASVLAEMPAALDDGRDVSAHEASSPPSDTLLLPGNTAIPSITDDEPVELEDEGHRDSSAEHARTQAYPPSLGPHSRSFHYVHASELIGKYWSTSASSSTTDAEQQQQQQLPEPPVSCAGEEAAGRPPSATPLSRPKTAPATVRKKKLCLRVVSATTDTYTEQREGRQCSGDAPADCEAPPTRRAEATPPSRETSVHGAARSDADATGKSHAASASSSPSHHASASAQRTVTVTTKTTIVTTVRVTTRCSSAAPSADAAPAEKTPVKMRSTAPAQTSPIVPADAHSPSIPDQVMTPAGLVDSRPHSRAARTRSASPLAAASAEAMEPSTRAQMSADESLRRQLDEQSSLSCTGQLLPPKEWLRRRRAAAPSSSPSGRAAEKIRAGGCSYRSWEGEDVDGAPSSRQAEKRSSRRGSPSRHSRSPSPASQTHSKAGAAHQRQPQPEHSTAAAAASVAKVSSKGTAYDSVFLAAAVRAGSTRAEDRVPSSAGEPAVAGVLTAAPTESVVACGASENCVGARGTSGKWQRSSWVMYFTKAEQCP